MLLLKINDTIRDKIPYIVFEDLMDMTLKLELLSFAWFVGIYFMDATEVF